MGAWKELLGEQVSGGCGFLPVFCHVNFCTPFSLFLLISKQPLCFFFTFGPLQVGMSCESRQKETETQAGGSNAHGAGG